MEIGIISDTHGFLDPRISDLFADCDEIWHAGDFGTLDVARQLRDIKPLRAVHGNIDDESIRLEFPEDLKFSCGGVDVWITHIAGRPGRYVTRVSQELNRDRPDVLVCGHSHILHVEQDDKYGGMQYINPGAAGHQGLHQQRTLLKCEISNGKLHRLRLIKLGPRGRTKSNFPS